jgi:hypothetical protein
MTRRAAKKGVALVRYGHLLERDSNYGLPVACYVCDAPHKALGLARIEDRSGTTHLPLCDRCLGAAMHGDEDALIRKYFNSPDLEISKGGKITAEQISAVVKKQDETEH